MSGDDEFDRLTEILRDTPRPDPAVRAAHIAEAEENFARRQGRAGGVRRNSDRRFRRRVRGVPVARPVTSPMRRNAVLYATTALFGALVLFASPAGRDIWQRYGGAPAPREVAEAPAPTPSRPAQAPAPNVVAQDADAAATPNASLAAPAGPAAEPAPPPPEPAETITAEAEMRAEPMPAPMQEFARGRQAQDMARFQQRVMPDLAAPAPAAVAPPADWLSAPAADTEAFANAPENPLRVTAEDPVSTFSIDVDTAAWSLVRQSLSAGQLPPADAVRVEEMINYFPYDYPAPAAGEAFRADVSVFPTPWNPDTLIARIGIQGEVAPAGERPPLNLVFLVDTSGSMQDPTKLPLLVASLKLMLPELRPEDEVAIVTYAGSAGVALPPTRAADRAAIAAALDRLSAEGSTNGEGGLRQAYATAAAMRGPGEVARIVLATDGDFNVGLDDTDDLTRFVARERERGTDLSVIGFGRGNLDDATMQALAQNGNGRAAYIDTLSEARKVLVDQLARTLFTIAKDVKIQVEWNPAAVAEWRLIGYETRALARTDFANDKVDAGELGAGTQVTALYELTPVGSAARRTEPLRYGAAPAEGGAADELGFLRLRWTAPGGDTSRLAETPIRTGSAAPDDDARFAAAIAGFGQILRGSPYLGDWGYADAIALAAGARGADPFGYRGEAVQLMRTAQGLSR